MKKIHLGIALLIASFSAPANAGCANYEDGTVDEPAPQVILCYRGKCDQTYLAFECGNIHGAQFGYANGLAINISRNGTVFTYKNRRVNKKEWSCVPLTEDACSGW